MKKLLLLLLNIVAMRVAAQVKTPAQLYPALFERVQMERVYADSKTFTDAIPLKSTEAINAAFLAAEGKPGFDLKAFVHQNFKAPAAAGGNFKTDRKQSLRRHIDTLWTVLKRDPDTARGGSLLPLPYPYIVPGGRFREVYYWDSYFTMLGLEQAKKYELMRNIVDNFAYLLDHYGHIPNGNRSYYLSRSQPPFFSLMVGLLATHDGKETFIKYRKQLLEEYHFWMNGEDSLKTGPAYERVVQLPDGAILNRYWDASNQPREESYREDVLAAEKSVQKPAAFYRNIRAAAESGWDFSSRWFADGMHLNTIQTTSMISVDLNCLLYHLEKTIAESYLIDSQTAKAENYLSKALLRKNAIVKYCWNTQTGYFTDFNWKTQALSNQETIATAYPLFFNIASPQQAKQVAKEIDAHFLKPGGVATTLVSSGQQWDMPNGWAPLQYITITGLDNYGFDSLGKVIAMRWISLNTAAFQETGKLLEKYNITLEGAAAKAGGGEYPLQDGFGWTNGVLLTLMNKYNVP